VEREENAMRKYSSIIDLGSPFHKIKSCPSRKHGDSLQPWLKLGDNLPLGKFVPALLVGYKEVMTIFVGKRN
jgi:hypothetical protein